jgi:PKD repeat protein
MHKTPCDVRRSVPRSVARDLCHLLAALGVVATLVACGGGGGGEDAGASPPVPSPPPPPPAANQAPTARFDAPIGAVAGQPMVFDGRASSDPEGSSLRFTWQFGDGSAGGTAQVAHLYPAAGTYTARLLVQDTDGATADVSRSVTVVAAPVAARSVSVAGRVTGIDGLPLAGVSVAVQGRTGAGSTVTTDTDGRATLSAGVGVGVVLRLSKPGYTDQVQRLHLPGSTGGDASFQASLMPRAAAQTLADAAAGGALTGTDGARVELPAAALVDAATGAAVTGPVQVTLTPVDVNAAAVAAFPGRFEGINGDGTRTPIVSFGTTEFLLSQAGRPLQLKPGARATIQLPVYASQDLGGAALAAGGSVPLWSLDERSAQWINEGQGTLVADAASPTGLALRAEVGHFSWWNADKGYTPYRPKPKCINDVPGQYDSIFEQATICKMLAEMDKPIPAQGSQARPARAQALAARPAAAAASAPRFPFPAVRIDGDVPMAGGVAIDIPPDYDVVLTGTALNGTWRGQVKVKGGQGATADVNVPLRPVAVGGSAERITLPFDQTRTAAPFRLDSYRFDGTAGQAVDVSVAAAGSTLTGRVRVLDAVGRVLDGSAFGTSTAGLLVTLPAAGEYRIEIEARTGAPGAYRLQAAAGAAATARLPSAAVSEGEPLSAPALLSQGGTALALWMERGSNSPVLMVSRNRSTDQDWQAAQALALAPGYSDALGLQARADATGQGWVMWNDGNGPVVARGPVAPGGAWPAPVALASATCRGADAQHLAVNASGQALAMWQRAGSIGVWCTRRFEGGVWLAEQVVDSTARFQVPGSTPVTSFPATLALTDAGRAVAVWQRNEFGGGLLSAQQDTATAAWTTPAVLISDTRAGGPALAASSTGTLALAWWSNGSLFAAEQPLGAAWSPSQLLGDIGGSGHVQLAWLGAARFAVAWNTFNSGPRLLEKATAQPWGAMRPLASGTALPLLMNLAADSDGSAATVSVANSRSGIGVDLVLDRRAAATGTWTTSAEPLAVRPVYTGGVPLPRLAPLGVGSGWADAAWLTFTTGSSPVLHVRAARLTAAP